MSTASKAMVGQAIPAEEALVPEVSLPTELEELRELITEGHMRGYLTQEEVTARLEENEVSEEQSRELHAYLADQGVEVIPADVAAIALVADAKVADDSVARKPEIDLSIEPSLDSLRLYLRSIGKVELLTAAE